MTRKAWLALTVIAVVFILIVLGAKAGAWTAFKSGNSATVAKGETLDSSLWAGAKNVNVEGTVNGDVFCGGQTVNISGDVKGDVICAAQTINISGTVEGSVRLAAQTINLSGNIAKSASLAAQTINQDSRNSIGTDASVAANDVTLSGSIGRDLAVAGSTVDVNGQVGRDIKSSVGTLTLTKGAKVGGSIDYTSKNRLAQLDGAQVAGTITQHQPKEGRHRLPSMLFFGTFAIFLALVLILSALIATAVLPQFIARVSEQGIRHPWWALLTGFIASIVVPIVIFLLLISVIAFPLAILIGLGWLLISLSSGLFSAFWLGRHVWRSQRNALLIVLAGSLILVILYIIPVVGIIALVLATWLGEGMVLLELKNHLPKPKYQLK